MWHSLHDALHNLGIRYAYLRNVPFFYHIDSVSVNAAPTITLVQDSAEKIEEFFCIAATINASCNRCKPQGFVAAKHSCPKLFSSSRAPSDITQSEKVTSE